MPATECTFCAHTNPDGSSFCNECGASLWLNLCRKCEAVNNRTALNCHKCGADLRDKADATDATGSLMSPPSDNLGPEAETKTASRASRRNAAFLVLPLLAVAAVYYGYHRYLQPAESLGDSVTIPSALPGTSEARGSPQLDTRSEAVIPKSAESTGEMPDAVNTEDGTAPAEPAHAETTLDNAPAPEELMKAQSRPIESRPAATSTKSGKDATLKRSPKGRDGRIPTSNSTQAALSAAQARQPTQGAPERGRAAACSDGVAALGLCSRSNSDERK